MKNLQTLTDKAAIGLSLICTIHCLAFPLLVVLLPSLSALPLNGESFHLWMVLAVIPTSIYALTMGCQKHKDYRLFGFGVLGLIFLLLALVLGEALHNEIIEKTFTILGAGIIAFGHYRNYQLCKKKDNCECSDI